MLKVLIVDDEPFILQGIKVLIDWNKEGYEEPYTAGNGVEALEILKNTPVDLIISDVKMPEMNGIELLKAIRSAIKIDAYFVILSGYAEFSYAQEALRYDCTDYILKPVDKDELIGILRNVAHMKASSNLENEEQKKREKAYFDRNMIALLNGKFDYANLAFLEENISLDGQMCYVGISLDLQAITDEFTDEEKKTYLRKLYEAAQEYLKEDSILCVMDVSGSEKIYDIGFIYCDRLGQKLKMTDKEYLSNFFEYLTKNTNLPITMLVGKYVNEIRNLCKSYGTSSMLRSLQGFREKKQIYYYEEECKISDTGVILCKAKIDELISAIELNEHNLIRQKVDEFYSDMQNSGIMGETMNLNINYLLFQLIHLASEQDNDVNQEEILRLISESTFEEGIRRGSRSHLCRMTCEYGDYLAQLRKNVSRGVLGCVEEEIKKNYATNLTLKGLSEKYYVNSAYLGQLFRKKYGCSFKDYLNKQRIDEAAKLLLRTDMKIYEIAEAVGYKDVDYFVNKFIIAKGCTPAKYRKQ